MKEEMRQWLNSQGNLPDFMRDFHDQKDLFKSMFRMWQEQAKESIPNVVWTDAMVFTVDFFLWFMAMHGYTLQRTRKKGIQFYSIIETVKHANKTSLDELANAIKLPQ